MEAVEGLGIGEARFTFRDDRGAENRFLAPRPVGKLERVRSISGEAFDFLRTATVVTPKITMPSPPTLHFWAEPDTFAAAGYPDHDAYFADLAAVYREEIEDLARRGATYIQMDEVPLAMLCDPTLRARLQSRGEDPNRAVRRYVELVNACVATRPVDVTLAMHLCRGNFKGRWLSEGGYQYVAHELFDGIRVDAFFLEFDTARAGTFEPLAAVPEDKIIVLGLLSTKTPALERREELIRRIEDASRFVPLDRLALSPQCGFASTVGGNPVTEADEVAKLERVVEVAGEVWG